LEGYTDKGACVRSNAAQNASGLDGDRAAASAYIQVLR
jgi:hypothetical protein